jgi:hypothetical protein
MYRSRGRVGISKLAVPVALIVILVAAGAYVFLSTGPKTSTTSQSSSSNSFPNVPLNNTVNQLIQDLNTRNVDGMVALYSPNAVSVWSGHTGGLSGLYTGTDSIRLIYATTVGKSHSLDANISNYAEKTLSPIETNATFVIKLISNSTVAGIVTATIDASQQWNWGGAGWQISKENWAYTRYDSTLVDAGLGSATTFPQWGYQLKGGNPNLVSEKSFEWHAGPYLAASVYAFMVGVAAFVALRLRSREVRPDEKGREGLRSSSGG